MTSQGKIKMVLKSMLVFFPLSLISSQIISQERSWVDIAVHNFGAPINTMWAEGELSFADDGTMVYCSARQDMAVAQGDPKDLYISTFSPETGSWNTPVNMGIPVNQPPHTDINPLRKGDDREPWITADGNTIYFRSDRLATTTPLNNHDLFVTHKDNGVWTEPKLVPFPISTTEGDEHCQRCYKMAIPCVLRLGVEAGSVVRIFTVQSKMKAAIGQIRLTRVQISTPPLRNSISPRTKMAWCTSPQTAQEATVVWIFMVPCN